jgi:hypothetical protein
MDCDLVIGSSDFNKEPTAPKEKSQQEFQEGWDCAMN